MRFAILSLTSAAALAATIASASALGFAAQTAPATTPSAATPAAADAAGTGDPNKIVCKSMPPATGTRIGSRRICQKQGDWDAQERQNQNDLSHEQNRGGLFSTPAG